MKIITIPDNLLYTSDHEWLKKENDGLVQVGITYFAQCELGDIVFVELPNEGDYIKAGASFGTVESVKTVSELYSPVSGKIVKVNYDLENSPEKVNEDPYGEGWMVIIESEEETLSLLTSDQYKEIIN